ncbi:MAG: AAA family ATPase [Saprospiraceae bacterium]|nr:AAA family ATPase [Saprospiraceae bacterium]
MPEELNKIEQNNQSYISRVRLKGYKSIIDTEVELKPGLNIIIGANGSGKTNFVEFLKNSPFTYFFNSAHECEIEGFMPHGYHFLYKRKVGEKIIENDREFIQKVQENYYVNGDLVEPRNYDFRVGNPPYQVSGIHLANLMFHLIEYNLPKNIELLDEGLSLEGSWSSDLIFPSIFFKTNQQFPNLVNEYVFSISDNIRQKKQVYRTSFYLSDNFEELILNLKKFSPVENLKIEDGFSFNDKNINNKVEFNVSFLKLQFYINDEWLYWNQLSDGTKRIFYIIAGIVLTKGINIKFLLEEPELGIHPHQLSRLMDFIKEQSETKQIIITTHSPEVLNTLGMNELDRIIVARYDKEKGTQLQHLSKDDMEYARNYMKNELFLSDYWVMSGFETEEEGV